MGKVLLEFDPVEDRIEMLKAIHAEDAFLLLSEISHYIYSLEAIEGEDMNEKIHRVFSEYPVIEKIIDGRI